eukprot:365084-Chlamydomonas_euryale.AAC.19
MPLENAQLLGACLSSESEQTLILSYQQVCCMIAERLRSSLAMMGRVWHNLAVACLSWIKRLHALVKHTRAYLGTCA